MKILNGAPRLAMTNANRFWNLRAVLINIIIMIVAWEGGGYIKLRTQFRLNLILNIYTSSVSEPLL
jgi:hypothetical protein